jgi:DNA-binding NarL/FixJ family response regulator
MNTDAGEIRILLVDDHQLMRLGLRHLLAGQPGLSIVGEAGNGPAAMEQVRTLAPHLVLMDLHLPGANGVEITRRILAEFPAVKVIALSHDGSLELVLQALHAGVSAYLLKENGTDELLRAIRAVMDHRLYLSPEISSSVTTHFMRSYVEKRAVPASVILTERERLLLRLIAEGKRNKEIAGSLAVAAKSAETYRSRVMKKLGCASTAELVRYAIREGIIQP